MAINTERFNLVKPSLEDPASIEVLNENFDKIDSKMLTLEEVVKKSKSNRDDAILGIEDNKFVTPYTLKEVLRSGGAGVGIVNNVFRASSKVYTFTASESTNKFTIPELDNTKEVEVYYKNLTLLIGQDFEVSRDSKECILRFELSVGESINYLLVSTSYDYNDLVNRPLENVDVYKSGRDENGIFTIIEEKVEGILHRRYVLSDKDSYGNYTKQTITKYKSDGITVCNIELWNIAYDENGNVISEVKLNA